MTFRTKLGTAVAVALCIAVASAAKADPLEIKVGWATTPTHIQPLIDALQKQHAELFHHFGKTYTAEGMHFQGSTPQIEALALKELQISAYEP